GVAAERPAAGTYRLGGGQLCRAADVRAGDSAGAPEYARRPAPARGSGRLNAKTPPFRGGAISQVVRTRFCRARAQSFWIIALRIISAASSASPQRVMRTHLSASRSL